MNFIYSILTSRMLSKRVVPLYVVLSMLMSFAGETTHAASRADAVEITVKGNVKDETGAPIPGANVLIKGTTNGTVTDSNGNYVIAVPSNESILIFSFIGYVTQEIQVNGLTAINVNLLQDAKLLEDVVVVGYGTQEKKDVTGAISTVKGSAIENLPVSSAQLSLQAVLRV